MDEKAVKSEATNRASRNDMSPAARRVQSRVMRVVNSPSLRDNKRRFAEARRRLTGAPHRVEYFHQADDPYSQLAAQTLAPLVERYDIDLVTHLVAPDDELNTPEPELLSGLAARDAAAIAPHYGLEAPEKSSPPAVSGDVASGNARRRKLGHYSGAMFYYAGEWYWGVDRLYHLEARLRDLGAARPGSDMRFPRPEIPMHSVPRADELRLEVFPSLRSPYTAIGFERSVELARATGVQLVVRPVLPMVMRGVPVTLRKGIYIMRDAVREGETLGVPFGNMLDPIGTPVRRGYSLWPFANASGRGAEYLSEFLRAAFAQARTTWTDEGLRDIAVAAGLDWNEARKHLDDTAWESELEANRVAMYDEMGLWGVPSFRLSGPAGEPELSAWGQDRLWLVAREIQRRGASPS